jgi:hypothetical protein
MNAVSGALQSVSNGMGSMMGAPKVVPPQGNVPPAPPAQMGGRRRNRKNRTANRKNRRNRKNNTMMRKNRKNRKNTRKNSRRN